MPAPILGASAALLEPAVVVADVDAAVALAVPADEAELLLCCSEECDTVVTSVREELSVVAELMATLVLVVSVGVPAEV